MENFRFLGDFSACTNNGYQALFFSPAFNEPGDKARCIPYSDTASEDCCSYNYHKSVMDQILILIQKKAAEEEITAQL